MDNERIVAIIATLLSIFFGADGYQARQESGHKDQQITNIVNQYYQHGCKGAP